jgi:hypothetical protein
MQKGPIFITALPTSYYTLNLKRKGLLFTPYQCIHCTQSVLRASTQASLHAARPNLLALLVQKYLRHRSTRVPAHLLIARQSSSSCTWCWTWWRVFWLCSQAEEELEDGLSHVSAEIVGSRAESPRACLIFTHIPPTDGKGFRDFYHTGRILFYNSWKEIFGKLQVHCSEFHEWQIHLNTKHGALYCPYSLVPDPQNFSIFLKCEAFTIRGWIYTNI